jgi:hypothetical protein
MAGYSSFSLKMVKNKFGLLEKKVNLFEKTPSAAPTSLLTQTLARGQRRIALNVEKSRSEFLVAPVMLEVAEIYADKIGVLSGENLDADKSQNLNGECDFIILGVPESSTVEMPLLCLVETESTNIMTGLGQCTAQMLGARLLNERENTPQSCIYGCVTTGYEWVFLKLEKQLIYIDVVHYPIDALPKILGIFKAIIEK